MKLHNELLLQFDEPLWCLFPELALFDVILDKNPQFVKQAAKDVLCDVKESNYGRKDSPTVEQVLRAAIYKEVKKRSYRDLESDMYDSKSCMMFLKLDPAQGFDFTTMQKFISKITPCTIRHIIVEINKLAVSEGIETVEQVSTDTTVIETDIHYPTNNSLIYDCIKTARRLLEKINKDKKDDNEHRKRQQQEAKKINYEINNTKKENQPALFAPYLAILQDFILDSMDTLRICPDSVNKHCKELEDYLPVFLKVYQNAHLHQILGVKVPNGDKVFSIFEPHTNIIVKGQRDIRFGHKTMITRGKSNIILDYEVYENLAADSDLLLPTLENVKENYERIPQSTSNDGGFFSKANIEGCRAMGIVNIVFTKVTKNVKNIVVSQDIERMLKRWRGTTEAVISNLKRGFSLQRVIWEGFEKFCAKIGWAILCYNLRVMTNRILEAQKA